MWFIIYLVLEAIYMWWNQHYFKEFFLQVQRSPLNARFGGVMACYAVLLWTLYYFIIKPKRSPKHAALLGFAIYAVYDLTNYATLSRWTLTMTVMDILWGTFAFGATTWLTYLIQSIR